MIGQPSQIIHATSVSVEGKGLVIVGPSGAGKSALALELMAYGATLVADDRTCVVLDAGRIIASAPETIAGLIEARGLGILSAKTAGPTPVAGVIDLSQTEKERLPEAHTYTLLGQSLPCLWSHPGSHFAAAILQYAKGGLGLRA